MVVLMSAAPKCPLLSRRAGTLGIFLRIPKSESPSASSGRTAWPAKVPRTNRVWRDLVSGLQKGPKNALPDGTRYEYDPILKRTVEVTPSGERFPVTLVDGKLQRDSEKTDRRKGETA